MPVSSRARVDFDGLELDKSFIERSKENRDPVAPDLVVADVIQIFSYSVGPLKCCEVWIMLEMIFTHDSCDLR